jgi:gluconate 2-dehydrogenase gamma chain
MAGWKLVGFPGARYDYRDFLDHNGARIPIEPVGLGGRPAWNPS